MIGLAVILGLVISIVVLLLRRRRAVTSSNSMQTHAPSSRLSILGRQYLCAMGRTPSSHSISIQEAPSQPFLEEGCQHVQHRKTCGNLLPWRDIVRQVSILRIAFYTISRVRPALRVHIYVSYTAPLLGLALLSSQLNQESLRGSGPVYPVRIVAG